MSTDKERIRELAKKLQEMGRTEFVKEFSKGGGIHIKKSHEGRFTAKANRAGQGVQEYARHVLANKDKYPSSTVKQAAFAKAASGWKHSSGGDLDSSDRSEQGGYVLKTWPQSYREAVARKWDPATTWNLAGWLNGILEGNRSHGEENEYWRAYLGLDNKVPKASIGDLTEWDEKVEADKVASGKHPSEFYGTTDRMNQMVQVLADTLNTGAILRDYDRYHERYPSLVGRDTLQAMYDQGRSVLNNPGKWIQVGEIEQKDGEIPQIELIQGIDPRTNERFPLGMLGKFGMKWNPESNTLQIHDTYDFPKWLHYIPSYHMIPKRPREMKIRGRVPFDPAVGSLLLRDAEPHPELMAAPIADITSH